MRSPGPAAEFKRLKQARAKAAVAELTDDEIAEAIAEALINNHPLGTLDRVIVILQAHVDNA